MVPCIVNSRLYVSGPTTLLLGNASCSRITAAITPATIKNNNAATTYMIPSRLWSTVATHLYSVSENENSRTAVLGRSSG